jgi:phosphoribosyl 1,2-cyclic phosphodiesterase
MQLKRQKPLPIPTRLDLHFWGTRGSIPVSGIEYQRYGGNTSCVSLTSDTGHLFIFDCGSGIRELGNFLLSNQWNPPTEDGQKIIAGYIFLSHTHWDHIQGFPFFNPVFRPHNRFNLMGWSNCSQTLMSIMAGQMEQIYFPVSLKSLPSELNFFSIQYGFAQLDGAQLSCKLLKHPLPSAAYRLELAGKVVVYATDHEPHDIPVIEQGKMLDENIIDPKLVELARDADVLIHDAQYSTLQLAHKRGWGHSSSEIAVDTAIKAGVKKLILFHHDPSHDDDTIDSLLEAAHHRKRSLGNSSLEILSAYDGMYLEV